MSKRRERVAAWLLTVAFVAALIGLHWQIGAARHVVGKPAAHMQASVPDWPDPRPPGVVAPAVEQ